MLVRTSHAIGVTLFRERFFHADPHPGNIMLVGEELKPGLIDFGQCTTLTKPQLRTSVSIGGIVANSLANADRPSIARFGIRF